MTGKGSKSVVVNNFNCTQMTLLLLSLFAQFLLLRGAQALHPTPAAWSGVDLSQLATEDANGTDFPFRASASSNSTIDALTLLKQRGANAFRMRVWNDPCADGRCNASEYSYANVQGLLTMATRTQAAGLRFIVDFHYSDWWADPGKQRKPTAWVGLSIDALVDAVENFTATTVRQLVAQGTPPHAVQIGNEITNGMLWSNASLGESCADGGKLYCKNSSGVRWPLADTWETLGRLVAAGIRAVRREAPTSLVAIHTDLGNHIKVDGAKYVSDWYQNLSNAVARAETARQLLRWKKSTTHDGDAVVNTSTTASLDYDLIGLSTYPTWDKGTTIDSIVEMGKLALRFPGKKVYIAETSYPAVPDSKGAPVSWQSHATYFLFSPTLPSFLSLTHALNYTNTNYSRRRKTTLRQKLGSSHSFSMFAPRWRKRSAIRMEGCCGGKGASAAGVASLGAATNLTTHHRMSHVPRCSKAFNLAALPRRLGLGCAHHRA
jgi:arabinogalactan endo-1,4-beta-galactosidase